MASSLTIGQLLGESSGKPRKASGFNRLQTHVKKGPDPEADDRDTIEEGADRKIEPVGRVTPLNPLNVRMQGATFRNRIEVLSPSNCSKKKKKWRRGWQRMRWLDNITNSMDMN